ncbi:NERD domain-containing protein [Paraburkholderia sp. MMS20-SJTR3]|uniref:NERD domain-containing protein n=1 Tax=Paraburkholderia sejongensis TaxID=2886946 RepID=A0ABS8K586_9BURK|nr:nuclease-related domain-containing protein [Paraburkholderia sp. MMS20-SJTR3]MCC8397263.1 NERD domain-containing protein [Paraburkholderia sp. MMS20-SJTR3]
MFLEILLGVTAWQLVTRKKRPSFGNLFRPKSTDRSATLGKAGEAKAHAALRDSLTALCGADYHLFNGPIIIEHAPGADFPTAEIDHLAVTPFGIFVFETKNWSGYVGPASVPGFLTRTDRDGNAQERRSPLKQNRTKVAFFRGRLPSLWPVAGAGLLVSDDAHLSPALHSDLLALSDLPHWLRARRDSYGGMPPVDVQKAAGGIALLIDTSGAAMDSHRARLTRQNLPFRFPQ